jgi:hypothetical protein
MRRSWMVANRSRTPSVSISGVVIVGPLWHLGATSINGVWPAVVLVAVTECVITLSPSGALLVALGWGLFRIGNYTEDHRGEPVWHLNGSHQSSPTWQASLGAN